MSGLTQRYQLPDQAARPRRARPRAFERQFIEAHEAAHQCMWWDTNTLIGEVVTDSSAANTSLGGMPAKYELEGSFEEYLRQQAKQQAMQQWTPPHLLLAPCAQSALVSDVDECRWLMTRALKLMPTPEIKFSTLVAEVLRSGIATVISPKRVALDAISRRVDDLRASAAEDNIAINVSSLENMNTFVQQLPFTAKPLVFLLDEGNFRLVWRGDKEQVALEFLGKGTIRYVFFAARPKPVSEAKSAGIDDAMHIVEQIKALGLAHLIGYDG